MGNCFNNLITCQYEIVVLALEFCIRNIRDKTKHWVSDTVNLSLRLSLLFLTYQLFYDQLSFSKERVLGALHSVSPLNIALFISLYRYMF